MWIKKGLVFAFLAAVANASVEDFEESDEITDLGNYALEDTLRGIIEEVRKQLKAGIPDKNIPPLDPMNVTHQDINILVQDIIKLDGFVKNVSGSNLLSFNITKLKASALPISFEMKLFSEPIDVRGQYKIDGNLINVIPIYGDGHFSGYFNGVFGYFRIDIGTKAGQLMVKKFDVDFGLKNVNVRIENFLGGVLGDVVCEIINENVPTMIEQFKIGYLDDIKKILLKEVNAFIKDKSLEEILDFIQGMFSTTTPAPTSPPTVTSL